MSNGPPPPPPPDNDQEIWWDDDWEAYVWWSGTANCQTDVSREGFDPIMPPAIEAAIEWIGENTSHSAIITGGHENGEHQCHQAECSRHYCGKAVDFDTNGWSTAERSSFKSWIVSQGWRWLDHGHIHMSATPTGCIC